MVRSVRCLPLQHLKMGSVHVQCQVRVCWGSDFSGGGFFSYSFGIFRDWQHSTRCSLSDSIEGQKEGSACYQLVSLHSIVLPKNEPSSSSEYSQGGHLSFSMHWDTRPCRTLKVCAFPVVRCTYLQVHRLLRGCRQHTQARRFVLIEGGMEWRIGV